MTSLNPSNRYNLLGYSTSTKPFQELNRWFKRGDIRFDFYTSPLYESNREFLNEKYGLNPTSKGLWINHQLPFHRLYGPNQKVNHLGFIHFPEIDDLELVFFPGKTKNKPGIEQKILEQIRKEIALRKSRPIKKPIVDRIQHPPAQLSFDL